MTAPTRALRRTALAGAVVFVALWVPVAIHWTPLTTVDTRMVLAGHGITATTGWLRTTCRIVSGLGGPPAVDIVAAVIAAALLVTRRIGAAVVVVVARCGELATETVVKLLVDRPRPVFDQPLSTAFGSSFPSGHAAGAAALYGALVLLLGGRIRTVVAGVAVVFVAAVGASRVLLGLHHPSDVVAGLALGVAWAAAAMLVAASRSAPESGRSGVDSRPIG